MTKQEFADKLAGRCDLSKAKAMEVMDCIFSTKPGFLFVRDPPLMTFTVVSGIMSLLGWVRSISAGSAWPVTAGPASLGAGRIGPPGYSWTGLLGYSRTTEQVTLMCSIHTTTITVGSDFCPGAKKMAWRQDECSELNGKSIPLTAYNINGYEDL